MGSAAPWQIDFNNMNMSINKDLVVWGAKLKTSEFQSYPHSVPAVSEVMKLYEMSNFICWRLWYLAVYIAF